MKALIIGATGATGKDLVTQLLNDDAYIEVHCFVRKPMSITWSILRPLRLGQSCSTEILRFPAWELPFHRLEAKKPSGV